MAATGNAPPAPPTPPPGCGIPCGGNIGGVALANAIDPAAAAPMAAAAAVVGVIKLSPKFWIELSKPPSLDSFSSF